MQNAQANPSTTQTNANLTGGISGKMLQLKHIFISSDTALTVSLMNSATHATELIKFYVAANGGLALGPDQLSRAYVTLVGEGFDYSTSANGNVFIKIGFEEL